MANDYYINDPRPLDPPEAFDLPDGKEEWVAEKAMEVRSTPTLMLEAFAWDGDQTGSESLYDSLACWVDAQQYFDEDERRKWHKELLLACQEVAERYAEFVLFPAMLEGLKNA